jgi:hypothetical protein
MEENDGENVRAWHVAMIAGKATGIEKYTRKKLNRNSV